MPKIIFLSWVWMFTDMFLLSKSSYIFCVQIFSCLETWSSCLCQSGQLIILWDLSPIATPLVSCAFLPASPKAKAGLGVQSHRPSVRPSVPKNLNLHHLRMLCAKFGWNWPSGSWEEVENRKSLQTDGRTDIQRTDDRGSEKHTCAFSSGKLFKIMNNMLIARRI